jgi:DNA-binding SARP family transcriptional activator
MLTVHLLGSPEVLLEGKPITVTRRKSRAWIYYLAANPLPIRRERLLAFFWPDTDRPSAQQTLRATLYSLRKALGAGLAVLDDGVSLAPDTDVDARKFDSNLQALVLQPQSPVPELAQLRATLALYHGDFLADFSLPGGQEFEDWASAERERYRRLMVRGLMALSQALESQHEYAASLDALDRALQFDPLQEDVQRAALRLHFLAGDRAGAIRRYEMFRKLLDAEMGVPPMAETRAMYDAIITDTLHIPAPRTQAATTSAVSLPAVAAPSPRAERLAPGQLPFAGRTVELECLRSLASSHKMALIEGEAGIGKTRLAEEFIAGSKSLPLVGLARELEYALPYQPVREALRSLQVREDWSALRAGLDLLPVWWQEVAQLVPEHAPAVPADGRDGAGLLPAALVINDESRLWEGIFQFLLAVSRQRSLIMLLDDLHWADASSLGLVGYLVRRIASAKAPILLIGTTRPVEMRSQLATLRQTLIREGRLEHIFLKRLSPAETSYLAQRLSQTYAHPLGDWLARASEGNPYMLTELVREAREKGILTADGTVNLSALPTSPVVPQSVYGLIQSRLVLLSDAARRVIDVGVAIGREFEFAVVARAAGLSEQAVLDALDELRNASLITPLDGLRFAFDHTLTMEVAYREAGEPRHRMIHRRVAEAMEYVYRQRLDEFAGLIAWHFAEGNTPERAAPYALRAARLAARLPAWKEAIASYEQALLGEFEQAERREIYMELGNAHSEIGEVAQATEAYREALALADDTASTTAARLALAQALMAQARFADAIEQAQAVVAAGGTDSPIAAEVIWGASLSIEGADLDGAVEHFQRAARLGSTHPDPARMVQIKFELGGVQAQRGNLVQAVSLYREALAAAKAVNDERALPWHIFALNNLGYHLLLLGDSSAAEYAQEGLRLAQEKGQLQMQPFLLSTLGEIALAANNLDVAEQRFKEGLTLAEDLNSGERIAGLTANLGLVAQRRGETTLAIHRLSTALARAESLGVQHLIAQIHLWLVRLLPPSEAASHLDAARAIAESGGRKLLLAEVERLEQTLVAATPQPTEPFASS